jgi:hypothetical protein
MSDKPGARRSIANRALGMAAVTFVLAAAAVATAQGARAFESRSCSVVSWEPLALAPWLIVAALPLVVYTLVIAYASRRRAPPVTLGEGPYRQSVLDEPTRIERPRGHRYAHVLVVVLALAAGAAESRRVSCPYAVPATCKPRFAQIVVMGVGNVEPGVVAEVATHFRECYGLPVTVEPPIAAPPAAWSAAREQWSAEAILAAMPGCHDGDPLCPQTHLHIGVTSDDLYTTKETWRYAFTIRDPARHTAILSTSRMGGVENLRKIVAKTIALEYCGLPQVADPRSVRYNGIMSTGDLRTIDEAVW